MRVLLLSMLGVAVWAQAPPTPRPGQPAPGTPAPAAPAAQPAVAVSPDQVVFKAGSKSMTKAQFDEFMQNLPAQLKQQLGGDTPEIRRRLAEQLSDLIAYSEEAKRRKIDQSPTVRVQAELQQQSLLTSTLYQNILETTTPSEADIKTYYDAHTADYVEVKARHILIRFQGSRVPLREGTKDLTDAEALAKATAIRERLVKGEDFAVVAKAESDDTQSGAQGGDLGKFGKGRMVPVFEQAAFTLPINEISQPVKSPFGYHLIQVQEKTSKPLTEVRPEIEKKLRQDLAQKAMESIKATAAPTLDVNYFGKPTAPPAPAPKQ